ncbi:mitochondrial uncoupling protein 3 [Phoenix dactylifera]|uniref:Mitochondrial uncoupling protein 3 n=1 Tax=Phoenix dactylifera TaxID=42345 RepID=A0A8B7CTG0_PHODC|nr:mitochondrial uncoupling protein 3 [Phoenix dactylifera]
MGGGRSGGGGQGEERRTLAKIALTSLSAAVAETATFPIDIIKTRLQLHGESAHLCPPAGTSAAGNALRVASEIWRKGGVLGFYSGLSPAVLRHLFYTPIRIVGYEHLRSAAGTDGSLLGKALAGGASGVLAQVVASPADLIKVRMQADSRLLSQGLQPRYAGIFDALTKIIQTEGFLGLWRGVFPNAQRAFLVNMGELTCYDHAKHFIIRKQICEDNVFAHTSASIASGLSATALSCPADVVKTRMMNQASGKKTQTLYRNSYDCLVKTVKFEGMMALWKGFFPTWARLGPWQFVFWVSYEKFRQAYGLSSF